MSSDVMEGILEKMAMAIAEDHVPGEEVSEYSWDAADDVFRRSFRRKARRYLEAGLLALTLPRGTQTVASTQTQRAITDARTVDALVNARALLRALTSPDEAAANTTISEIDAVLGDNAASTTADRTSPPAPDPAEDVAQRLRQAIKCPPRYGTLDLRPLLEEAADVIQSTVASRDGYAQRSDARAAECDRLATVIEERQAYIEWLEHERKRLAAGKGRLTDAADLSGGRPGHRAMFQRKGE